MGKRIVTKRIGEILLERRVITQPQLEQALTRQKEHGGLLGQILVELGATSEEDVALALTAGYALPYLPLNNYDIGAEVIKLIPEQLARQHCVVPIDRVGNSLTVAMADPSNLQAIEDMELLTSCVLQIFVSTASEIRKTIERCYKHATPTAPAPPKAGAP